MINLSNGHSFEYMAASGALAFGGRGWPWEWPLRWVGLLDPRQFTVVTKTLTLAPRKGNFRWYNPLACVRFIRDGVVNAVDLTNPGLDWWCRKAGQKVDSQKIPLVVSIYAENIAELAKMCQSLNRFDLIAVKLNLSCPNAAGSCVFDDPGFVIEFCQAAHRLSRFPIIIKISVTQAYHSFLPRLENIVEAVAINSVPWDSIFPGKASPLARLGGGGVSGKAAQRFTWSAVNNIARKIKIPVIGPSVWEFEDLDKLRQLGASAISFGSIFFRPWLPNRLVRQDRRRKV